MTRREFSGLAAALLGLAASPAKAAQFYDYGLAPEFTGIERWLNTEPLTMASLRGSVVLVDFWTYACINCQRALPYVVQWHERYKEQGLVVVGVHTPEYAFERSAQNVQAAIKRLGIDFPVAQDNRYATWRAFDNSYWPASYLIDRRGRIMLKHVGEGAYEETEAAIRTLLAQPANEAG